MDFKEWINNRPPREELEAYRAAAMKTRMEADAQIAFFNVLIGMCGSGVGETPSTPPVAADLAAPEPVPPVEEPKKKGRKRKCFGDLLEIGESKCLDCAWKEECEAEAAKAT
jgi:hypothetical protein